MNPLVSSLIGAGVRWLLTMLAAREIVVGEDTATQLAAGAVAIATIVWSAIQKSRTHQTIQDAKAGLL